MVEKPIISMDFQNDMTAFFIIEEIKCFQFDKCFHFEKELNN